MKILIYGAGKIGRGFIGALLGEAGHEITFIDVAQDLIEALRRRGSYTVTRVGVEGASETVIKNVRIVDGRDHPEVIREIGDCDLLATSLGARVLELAAPLIADGLAARARPLNVLICENLKDAPRKLEGWLRAALGEKADAVMAATGLIETAIGAMVPDHAGGSIEDVVVEDYRFLPADARALVGPLPEAPGLAAVENMDYYEERKLYLHNMGHAVAAYLGVRLGYERLADATRDPAIRLITQNAMTECAAMLAAKYDRPFAEPFAHAEDLLYRFGNRALGDTCERVARDPRRKLAPDDRLIGAARACEQRGIPPAFLCVGIAAALDALAGPEGDVREALREACGLEDGFLAGAILELHGLLRGNCEFMDAALAADALKRRARGPVLLCNQP